MATNLEMNCERLREAFEGRDAIYVEKGVLRVRVTNIRYNVAARDIAADIEEVSSQWAGGYFFGHRENPRRWKISCGSDTTFSEHTWKMGYGGWSLFFAPEIMTGLAAVANDWSTELGAHERYTRALHFLMDHGAYEQVDRVFSD